MNTTLYSILMIAICALCTLATRVFPFALFGGGKKPPALVRYLGKTLPPAVTSVLIIYSVQSVNFAAVTQLAPTLISIALVVLLHIWKRNNLLSIGAGTVCYMLLVQLVF